MSVSRILILFVLHSIDITGITKTKVYQNYRIIYIYMYMCVYIFCSHYDAAI